MITLSLTGMLMTAVIKGIGLPVLSTKTLIGSARPISSRHSTIVSKLYVREGTRRGSWGEGREGRERERRRRGEGKGEEDKV